LFENRVLSRVFGPEREEVTGRWRELHSEEFHSLNSSADIIRTIRSSRMRMAGNVVSEIHTEFKLVI
jgi:hypothetical protein